MHPFRDIPLNRKLTLVVMVTSTAALLLSTLAVVSYEIVRLRGAMARNVSTEAAVIADNSTAALSFHDAKAARETLASLHHIPEIVLACVYGSDGRVFAEYARSDAQNAPMPPMPQVEGPRFTGSYLNVFRRVELDGEVIGGVYLRADLREQAARIGAFGVIVGSMTIASWLVAFILSRRLQQLVSQPILALSHLAREVGAQQDYSLRAAKHGNDEIGVLTDGFNQMLAEIQKRDEHLRASEERFRQVTESIHEVFWMSDIEKDRIIYVSPGYELIWGRNVDSLYDSPRDWLAAIHPDDRERVRQAALTKQATGEYDEEYRIVRPDGNVRWIRDRAFPVRDAAGQVYRIAGIADDITERKQFVEVLQRQQSELKVLFDLIPAMIWFKDSKNRILRLNKRAAEMAGKSVEEIEGKPTVEIHPKEATKFYADDLEVIRSGMPKLGIVETLRTPDGKEFWVQTDKVPYWDKAGKVIGIVVVAQDITDRKRAEESLRLLGSAVEQSKESIVITDAQLDLPGPRILFVNPAFTNMTGYVADEVLGKTPRILQGPRTDKTVLRRLRQTLSHGEPFLGETINYRKDGTEFYLEWHVTPIREPGGSTTHFVAIQRDITERKLAEARMTTLAQAVESTSELICITDLHDQFTFVNRAFMQAYGYAEQEVLGRTPGILFSPHNSPVLVEEILKQTRSGGWQGEVLDRRKDGTEFPISLSTSQIKDKSGQVIGLMGVARDITERKRLEKEILEISDRERARLGQDLHDDLCQQLVSIAFASNLLTQKLRKKSVPEAAASGEIALWLDGAITHARTLARGLCPVTLETEGLAVALQDLAATVGSRFQIECRLDCLKPVVVHDLSTATHLYRIAQEAITNAVRHAHASCIIIRLESADREVTLRVADDGIGIQDPKTVRLGMGLQTMYCRATLIGGKLQIERRGMGGTEVICRIHLEQK